MALTIEEVRKIASLARLRLSPEEEATFGGQLGKIVDYIDQLGSFAAAPVELAKGSSREADDRPRPCLPRDRFLANAPAVLDGFLLVPEIKGSENA